MGRKGKVLTKNTTICCDCQNGSSAGCTGCLGCRPGVSGLEGGRARKAKLPQVSPDVSRRKVHGGAQLSLPLGVLVPWTEPRFETQLAKPCTGEQGLWKVTRCFQDKRQVSGRWVLQAQVSKYLYIWATYCITLCQSGRSVCSMALSSRLGLMPTLPAASNANKRFLFFSWLFSSWYGMWAGR